jgi:hypothetical protein
MLNEVRQRFGRLRARIYSDNVSSIMAAQSAGLEIILIDR